MLARALALTSVSDVEQHGHEDVVNQSQGEAIGEQGVPDHQEVLQWELSAKQQTHPPSAGNKSQTQGTVLVRAI